MMGSLGGIAFKAVPPQGLSISQSVDYATRSVIGRRPTLEFVSPEVDSLSLGIKLRSLLGHDPSRDWKSLVNSMWDGEVMTLFLGEDSIGDFVVSSVTASRLHHNQAGILFEADLDLSLLRYS